MTPRRSAENGKISLEAILKKFMSVLKNAIRGSYDMYKEEQKNILSDFLTNKNWRHHSCTADTYFPLEPYRGGICNLRTKYYRSTQEFEKNIDF